MKQQFKFDYSLLLGLIKTKGYTQETLAQKIGISGWSVWNKLSGKGYFTQPEIAAISQALGISQDLISVYFFTPSL